MSSREISLPELNIPLEKLTARSGVCYIVVPEELRGEAMFLIKMYMKISNFDREVIRLKHFLQGKAKFFKRTMTKQMFMKYFMELQNFTKSLGVEKVLEEFVDNVAMDFVHCRYMWYTGFVSKKSLVALIQEPPQITMLEFGQFVKPSPYINICFIPTKLKSGKVHAPLVANFFYGQYKA